jgi:hypothetical protein
MKLPTHQPWETAVDRMAYEGTMDIILVRIYARV